MITDMNPQHKKQKDCYSFWVSITRESKTSKILEMTYKLHGFSTVKSVSALSTTSLVATKVDKLPNF